MGRKGWMCVVRVFGAWKVWARIARRQRLFAARWHAKAALRLLRRCFLVWYATGTVAAERARTERMRQAMTEQQKQVSAGTHAMGVRPLCGQLESPRAKYLGVTLLV